MDHPALSGAFARPDTLVGRTVGRYRLVEKIGAGGMGSVYRAVHIEIEDLVVAVKLLLPGLIDDEALRRRFKDEAAICARLSERSSHIVQIRDYGILADLDLPYFTMEYLQGRSLQHLMHKVVAPVQQGLAIARQICLGLQVAHSMGVVHRDLKPSNIVLVPDPQLGEKVKLLDFGIARLVRDAQRGPLTQGYLGTPQYSSPEQLRGLEIDTRADIYSLGMILYELFSGVCPFAVEEQNFETWYVLHTEGEPSPMAAANPRQPVPIAIEQLVLHCLAKKPADRPAGVSEILARLELVMGHLPPAPPAAAIPPPTVTLSAEQVAHLEKQLATQVGPIAPTLVRRALGSSHTPGELVEQLAAQLPATQREQFSRMVLAGLTMQTSAAPAPVVREGTVPPVPRLDPRFVERCGHELSRLVGPIAAFLLQSALKETPPTPAVLVERLAALVGDQVKAEQLRRKLL